MSTKRGSEESILPSDCVLAFGIPTTEAGFMVALHAPERHEYTQKLVRTVQAYRRGVQSHIDRVLPAIHATGAKVATDVTLSQYGNLFSCGRYRAVTLFSHYGEEEVEYSEGMRTIADVVQEIPASFDGIIDLCVCHPERLVVELAYRCPKANIRHMEIEATPAVWLSLYLALYKRLTERHVTYMDALSEVFRDYYEGIKQIRREEGQDGRS